MTRRQRQRTGHAPTLRVLIFSVAAVLSVMSAMCLVACDSTATAARDSLDVRCSNTATWASLCANTAAVIRRTWVSLRDNTAAVYASLRDNTAAAVHGAWDWFEREGCVLARHLASVVSCSLAQIALSVGIHIGISRLPIGVRNILSVLVLSISGGLGSALCFAGLADGTKFIRPWLFICCTVSVVVRVIHTELAPSDADSMTLMFTIMGAVAFLVYLVAEQVASSLLATTVVVLLLRYGYRNRAIHDVTGSRTFRAIRTCAVCYATSFSSSQLDRMLALVFSVFALPPHDAPRIIGQSCPFCRQTVCQECSTSWTAAKPAMRTWACCGKGRKPLDMCTDEHRVISAFAAQHAQLHCEESIPGAHRCPGCGVLITRAEGCPHMTCTQCGTIFCDLCGKERYHEGYHICFDGNPFI